MDRVKELRRRGANPSVKSAGRRVARPFLRSRIERSALAKFHIPRRTPGVDRRGDVDPASFERNVSFGEVDSRNWDVVLAAGEKHAEVDERGRRRRIPNHVSVSL